MKKLTIFLSFVLLLNIIGCGPELLIGPAINFYLAWKDGEAHKHYNYDAGIVYRAAKRSMLELGIPIDQDDGKNSLNYYFTAGGNNRFKVKITHVEPTISKLSVRIDFMGDKSYAELFYKKVDRELSVIKYGPDGRPVSYPE